MPPQHPRLFISHSHEDRNLVDELTQLLVLSISGLSRGDIRCTSNPTTGLGAGGWVTPSLRDDIRHCDCFIALVSDSYLSSRFCLCELGMHLGARDSAAVAVYVPGIDPNHIDGVFSGMNLLALADSVAVNSMLRQVAGTNPAWTANPNAVQLEFPVWIIGKTGCPDPAGVSARDRVGNLLIFRFTARGHRRPLRGASRPSRISSKIASCSFAIS